MTDKEILIERGKTFVFDVRWEVKPLVYKAITAIDLSHGAPRLTVQGHGLVSGWSAAVARVVGMKQINAEGTPPKASDYRLVTVVDADTIEFNEMDATGFSPYVSGGFVQFYTPQDLAGYVGRFVVKDRIGGNVLLSSRVEDAPLNLATVSIDLAEKKIVITIDADDTEGLPFRDGVAELEMESSTGVVTKLKITSTGRRDEPDPVRVSGEVAV